MISMNEKLKSVNMLIRFRQTSSKTVGKLFFRLTKTTIKRGKRRRQDTTLKMSSYPWG